MNEDGTRLRPATVAPELPVGAEISVLPRAPNTGSVYTPPPAVPPGASQLGRVLSGRYRIEGELGAGGMGIVYVAVDAVGNERVAIKLLRPESRDDPRIVAALREEVIKTRRLRHDNIVGVYGIEQDGDDLYVVMEFLQGATLQSLLDEEYTRGMPLAQAWEILRGAAAALTFAHGKGIIHSDIKPSNIFLTASGHVKVLDFGIARTLRVGAQRFDTRNLAALTPAYATIEMSDGSEPTEADDVFSLACVAYELLTGRHPFDHRDIRAALNEHLVPAPVATLSDGQNRALLRGLAFMRADRYPTIAAFVQGLAQPSSTRSSKPALLIIGALVAIGVASAGGYAWYAQHATAVHQPGDRFKDCASQPQSNGETTFDCPAMVVIPAGSFHATLPNGLANPPGQAGGRIISFPAAFAVESSPVTRAQFRTFAKATGRQSKPSCVDHSNAPGIRPVDFSDPGFQQSDDDPVVCVTLDDAHAYANWVNQTTHQTGYHLLTEAEWEYAARAGSTAPYPWGSQEGTDVCTRGNFGDQSFLRASAPSRADTAPCDDNFRFTSPVHAFPANAWGLRDMLGNVREWTDSCSHPGDGPLNGAAWLANCRQAYGVVRGAGYATPLGGPYLQVATARTVAPPGMQATNEWGFRLARYLP
jgi:formylglycine-generating enzyme required for sulfatase activity